MIKKSTNPQVSIILPCYNVANCMSDMFMSLRNQTFSDIEIICVDDKSTDDTAEQIKSFMQLDKRICLYKLPKNGGVGHARNYGLKKATGKFVCFLDPDDYIDNDFVEKLYNGITKNKSDVAKGTMIDGKKISKANVDIRKNHLYFNQQHWSAMYNRDFLLKNNILYPEDVLTGQDAVFLSNLVLHTNKILTTDDAFYHYVRRDGSLDSAKQLSHDKILSRIKMLGYKVQMLNSYVFDTDENKNIFIRCHILNHFMYAFDIKRVSETDQKMLFDWLIKHADIIGYDNLASHCKSYQIQAIKNHDFGKFVTPGYKGKLFYKERYPDGHRTIYFCGVRFFSYYKKPNIAVFKSDIYKHKSFLECANIETIILGSSHGRDGYIPNETSFNLANSSQDLYRAYKVYEYSIKQKNKQLKNVILFWSVFHPGLQLEKTREYLKCIPYKAFYGIPYAFDLPINDYLYIKELQKTYAKTKCPKGYRGKSLYDIDNSDINAAELAEKHIKNTKRNNNQIQYLEKIAELAKRHGHNLYIVLPPYRKDYLYNLPVDKKIYFELFDFLKKNRTVKLLDFQYDKDFNDSDFYSPDHCNEQGAKRLTLKINKCLQK